jgi:hypothetical protein
MMSLFLTVAVILGLTALFSYLNDRLLHLEQTIGLMVLALVLTLALITAQRWCWLALRARRAGVALARQSCRRSFKRSA